MWNSGSHLENKLFTCNVSRWNPGASWVSVCTTLQPLEDHYGVYTARLPRQHTMDISDSSHECCAVAASSPLITIHLTPPFFP